MHFLCDKSAWQCLTKVTALHCGLADPNGHSDLCFSLQEVWREDTEHRFVAQSRYKPKRTNKVKRGNSGRRVSPSLGEKSFRIKGVTEL